jgi:hypothetical protein
MQRSAGPIRRDDRPWIGNIRFYGPSRRQNKRPIFFLFGFIFIPFFHLFID